VKIIDFLFAKKIDEYNFWHFMFIAGKMDTIAFSIQTKRKSFRNCKKSRIIFVDVWILSGCWHWDRL
jgi:hypothetical protein